MPSVNIRTNAVLPPETAEVLLREASRTMAACTGKPEDYVMAGLTHGAPIIFAGSAGPAAWLEVRSIDYPPGAQVRLAAGMAELLTTHAGVPAARTYTVFDDVQPSMRAVGGESFG